MISIECITSNNYPWYLQRYLLHFCFCNTFAILWPYYYLKVLYNNATNKRLKAWNAKTNIYGYIKHPELFRNSILRYCP